MQVYGVHMNNKLDISEVTEYTKTLEPVTEGGKNIPKMFWTIF